MSNVNFSTYYANSRAASVSLPGVDLGVVFEGSSCDTGRGTCSQGVCREPTYTSPDTCPGTSHYGYCSSNGVKYQ